MRAASYQRLVDEEKRVKALPEKYRRYIREEEKLLDPIRRAQRARRTSPLHRLKIRLTGTGPPHTIPRMPSPSTLAAFSVTALLFVLFPGPAMLFLVARGVAGGPRVGAFLGSGGGDRQRGVRRRDGLRPHGGPRRVHDGLQRRPVCGRCVPRLPRRPHAARAGNPRAPVLAAGSLTPWTSWRQGFLVGIGNPKAALFFLAFFPQFIHPEAGPAYVQVLVLGAVIIAIGTCSTCPTASSAGWCARGWHGAAAAACVVGASRSASPTSVSAG